MSIKITVPLEILINTSTPACTGIFGTDLTSLDCTLNSTDKSLTITNAFKLQTTAPWSVVLSISPLINP